MTCAREGFEGLVLHSDFRVASRRSNLGRITDRPHSRGETASLLYRRASQPPVDHQNRLQERIFATDKERRAAEIQYVANKRPSSIWLE
jgi:hypothetical protein